MHYLRPSPRKGRDDKGINPSGYRQILYRWIAHICVHDDGDWVGEEGERLAKGTGSDLYAAAKGYHGNKSMDISVA